MPKTKLILLLLINICLTILIVVFFSNSPSFKALYKSQAAEEKIAVIDEMIGVAHIAPLYPVRSDSLTAGMAHAYRTGFRTISLVLNRNLCQPTELRPNGIYHNMSFCTPSGMTLSSVVESNYYRQVFNFPFETINIYASPFRSGTATEWMVSQGTALKNGFTQDQLTKLYKEYYEFVKSLYKLSAERKKDIIIESANEIDWKMLVNKNCPNNCDSNIVEPDDQVITNVTSYFNTVQRAVSDARNENAANISRVWHACEINLVKKSMNNGKKSAVNTVLPNINCDLYGYSAYDTLGSPSEFEKAIDYIRQKAPDSQQFGNNNVFISEWGYAENKGNSTVGKDLLRQELNISKLKGLKHFIFWQLYDNECTKLSPQNKDCLGFWIYKPDGSKGALFPEFTKYMHEEFNDSTININPVDKVLLKAGESKSVIAELSNTGSTIWKKDAFYRLGVYEINKKPGWIEGRVELPKQILPGEKLKVSVTIHAPKIVGDYKVKMRMVQENIAWFGKESSELVVGVID